MLQSYADTEPKQVNLLEYLKDESNKDEVLTIRAVEDMSERKAMKAALPAVTISGIFSGRGEKNLVVHSGLICIDIDQKDNEHIEDFHGLKDLFSDIPYVAYCALSVSGNGYWLIIPISNPKKHKEHFLAIQKTFKQAQINIDPAPSNVASLRGYSYDENAYYNHEASVFPYYLEEPVKPLVQYWPKQGNNNQLSPFDDFNENGDIEDLLTAHDWKFEYQKGTKRRYCRPGKNNGVSADYCTERKIFFVFTNGSVFEPNKGYNHTSVFAKLECNDDFKLCREKLVEMNYGKN